ncbi:MAG TPA: hypothetical protein VNJ01_16425 [Bacteriovoracaceae bacterium]|nr:hypothetical protein [Bacteriovoracaceae bacterium]
MIKRLRLLAGLSLLFLSVEVPIALAEEINFASCRITVKAKQSYSLAPVEKSFMALWPWEKNKGISFKTNFSLTPKTASGRGITLEVQLREGTIETKLSYKKDGAYIGSLTQHLLATKQKEGSFAVSFGAQSTVSKVSLTCTPVAAKEVLVTETEDIEAILSMKMCRPGNCSPGVLIEKIPVGEILDDGEVLRVETVENTTAGVSAEELLAIREQGLFYDRSPSEKDATDEWIARLSPYIPFSKDTSLQCPVISPGDTLPELELKTGEFLQEVKRIMSLSLNIPIQDQSKLTLPQSLECEEAVDYSLAHSAKPFAAIKSGLAKAQAQCAVRFCQEFNSSRELRLPYRYFRTLVMSWRPARWKELVGDSVQPFVGLSSNSNYYKDSGLDLHFVKVPKGGRADAKAILAQILVDRLKISPEEGAKLAEQHSKSAEGQRALQVITREVTHWQMNLRPARSERTGLIQLDAKTEILPILNLRTGVIEDLYEKESSSLGLAMEKKDSPKAPLKSPVASKKIIPSRIVSTGIPGPGCLAGYSGSCFSKKDLVGSPANLRDVLLLQEQTAIEENFAMTSGTGERSQLFTVKVPSGFNCENMNAETFKNMFYQLNSLHLRQVNQSYNKNITWNPGSYPHDDGSVGYQEQQRCRKELGEGRLLYCRWRASCVMGKRAEGVRAALAMNSLLKDEKLKDAKEYIKKKSVAVPNGSDLEGELEFISFGSEWKELRARYLDCSNAPSEAKCSQVQLSPEQLDFMLMRTHNFSTLEEFRKYRDSEPSGKYRKWYDHLVKVAQDPKLFINFVKSGFVDEGLYVLVPSGQTAVDAEGIAATENPFRVASDRAYGINLLKQTVADQKLRGVLRHTSPLIKSMYVLGLEKTDLGRTLENSNAEFHRGAVEYLQSWTSKPVEAMFQTLSTDGGQKALQVMSCLNLASNPTLIKSCLWGPNSKGQMLQTSVSVNRFNEKLRNSLDRPEALYCAQTDLGCLETWARMAPAFVGDTGLMLLSAPLGGAGVLASGMLISARQASDSYYSTVQMELQKIGRTWEDLATSTKDSDVGLRNSIISAAVKNGMITFAVTSAANIAGMKAQQLVASKILATELTGFNTSVLGRGASPLVQELTQKQVAVRALIGELVGGVPVNLSQASVDLIRQCKMFNQCDDAAFTSALLTSMIMMAPMTVGPSVYRIATSKAVTGPSSRDLKIPTDFQRAVDRQQRLEVLRSQKTLGDLGSAEGAVRYVLRNGTSEPEVLLKTKDGFGWFDMDRAVIKLEMERRPQAFRGARALEPNLQIKRVEDLQGVLPKEIVSRADEETTLPQQDSGPVAPEKNFRFLSVDGRIHNNIKPGQILEIQGSSWKVLGDGHNDPAIDYVNLVDVTTPTRTLKYPLSQKKLAEASIKVFDLRSSQAKARKDAAIKAKVDLEVEYTEGIRKLEESGLAAKLAPSQIEAHKKTYQQGMIKKYQGLEETIVTREAEYVEIIADSFRARGYIVEVESPTGFTVAKGAKRLKIIRGTDGSEKDALSVIVIGLKQKKYQDENIQDRGDDFYYDPTENRRSRSWGGAYWIGREMTVGHTWDQSQVNLLSMLEIHEVFHTYMNKAISVNPNVKPEQAMRGVKFRTSQTDHLPGSSKDKPRFNQLYSKYPKLKDFLETYMVKKNLYNDDRTVHEVEARFASASALLAAEKNPNLNFKIEPDYKMAIDSLREALILSHSDVENITHVQTAMANSGVKYSVVATLNDGNQIKAGFFNASIYVEVPAAAGPPPSAAYAVSVPGMSFKIKPGESTVTFEKRVNQFSIDLLGKDRTALNQSVTFVKSQLSNLKKVRQIMIDELARDYSDDSKIMQSIPRIRQRLQKLDDSEYTLSADQTRDAVDSTLQAPVENSMVNSILNVFRSWVSPAGESTAVAAATVTDVSKPYFHYPELNIPNAGLISVGHLVDYQGVRYQVWDTPVAGAPDGWLGLVNAANGIDKIKIPVSQKKLTPEAIGAFDSKTVAVQNETREIWKRKSPIEKKLRENTETKTLTPEEVTKLEAENAGVEQELVASEVKVVGALAESLRARGYVVTVEDAKGYPGAKRLKVVRGSRETHGDVFSKRLRAFEANRYLLPGMIDSGDSFYYNPTMHRNKNSIGHVHYDDREMSMGSSWDHFYITAMGMTDVHEGFHMMLRRAISLNPNVKPEQAMRATAFSAEGTGDLPGSKEDVSKNTDLLNEFPAAVKSSLISFMKNQYKFYSSYRAADEVDARLATVSAFLTARKNPNHKIKYEYDERDIKDDLKEVFILANADIKNIDHALKHMETAAPDIQAFWTYDEGNQTRTYRVDAQGNKISVGFLNASIHVNIPATPGPPAYGAYKVTVPGKALKIKPNETQAQFEARVNDWFAKIKSKDPAVIKDAVEFATSQMKNLRSVRQVMVQEILPGLVDETKLLDSVPRIKQKLRILDNVNYDIDLMPEAFPAEIGPEP